MYIKRLKKNSLINFQILIYLILLLGIIGLYLYRFYTVNSTLIEGAKIRISGQISEDPIIQNRRQRLVIGNVRIYTDPFPQYLYGDKIIATGVLTKGKGGWFLKEVDSVEKLERVESGILTLRRRVLTLYKEYLPEPHASLLSGIVLGTKTSLDSGFFEALRKTGTLHIVVASGTNISIFAGTVLNIFAYMIGRRKGIVPTLLAVWFYVFLAGWQPPVVRAAIMGSIAFTAQALGREFDTWRALFLSCVVLLILNPLWLFDLGFQLSFAATAGILAFQQGISRILALLPIIFKQDIATTLSAQIAVSPILLLSFGQLSLIAPVVNALILWSVPPIMAGGMIMGVVGLVFEPAGQLIAWFLWIPLEYFVRIVKVFG